VGFRVEATRGARREGSNRDDPLKEEGREGDLVDRRGVECSERLLEASELGFKRGCAAPQVVLVGGVLRD
jgi:hypothetical protein